MFVKAWNYVCATTKSLEEYSREFPEISQKADLFVKLANEKFESVVATTTFSEFATDATDLLWSAVTCK